MNTENYLFKPYEDLTFSDNFMFCEILRNDPELCKEIIETILDVKIKEIVTPDKENTVKVNFDGHGVRLDVFIEGDDAVYDIEMQTRNEYNLPKRSRYYQGILDTDYLKSGEDYNALKKTFIIFICKFDPCGRGLSKYTFRNVAEEDRSILLNDGTVRVFLNTEGSYNGISEKMKEFLQYVGRRTITGKLTKTIDSRVAAIIKNEEGRARYMTLEWELAKRYREGREEGRLELIQQMLQSLSVEQLISMGISEDEIKRARGEQT